MNPDKDTWVCRHCGGPVHFRSGRAVHTGGAFGRRRGGTGHGCGRPALPIRQSDYMNALCDVIEKEYERLTKKGAINMQMISFTVSAELVDDLRFVIDDRAHRDDEPGITVYAKLAAMTGARERIELTPEEARELLSELEFQGWHTDFVPAREPTLYRRNHARLEAALESAGVLEEA